jgi:hypothetical protein
MDRHLTVAHNSPVRCCSLPIPDHAPYPNQQVILYEHAIPDFAERQLEVLYENIYSTLARFRVHDRPEQASTYAVMEGDTIRSIILFTRQGSEIRVLNQQIALTADEISLFCQTIFRRYGAVGVIAFHALDATLEDADFLFLKYCALEENVVDLPATPGEYVSSMSPNFRARLRRAQNKIVKDYPSFDMGIFTKNDITEQLVRELIRFAGARMALKKKNAYIGEQDVDSVMRLVRTHGYLVAATIDGKLCGGSIWYAVGRRSFMHVNTHDPRFDEYMLGNQVMLMGIRHWIEQGGRECWLMGGFGAHKAKFRARQRRLDSVVVYRSRTDFWLDWRRVAKARARMLLLRLRHELRQRSIDGGWRSRFYLGCLALGRVARKLWQRGG